MTTSYWYKFEQNQKKITHIRSLAKATGLKLGRSLYFAGMVAPLVVEAVKLIPLAHNPVTLPLALIKFSLETCHVAAELKHEFSKKENIQNAPSPKKGPNTQQW